MLASVRGVEHVSQLFRYQAFDDRPVDRHAAQGCLPSFSRAHRQSAEADKVGGTKHDHARYTPPGRCEPGIGGSGDLSGVDVAGIRRDQRLGRGGICAGSGAAEKDADLELELDSSARVERSGDRGGTDGRQGLGLQQGPAYFIAEPELPDLTNPGMEQGFSHGSGSRWFAIYRALLASAR